MPCDPGELKHVPLFELLDDDELAVLAAQVEKKHFSARQRVYKTGDPSAQAYIVLAGNVRVTTIDEDQQEVLIDELAHGGIFGFRLHARPDTAPDQRDGHAGDRLHRVGPGRHTPRC